MIAQPIEAYFWQYSQTNVIDRHLYVWRASIFLKHACIYFCLYKKRCIWSTRDKKTVFEQNRILFYCFEEKLKKSTWFHQARQ